MKLQFFSSELTNRQRSLIYSPSFIFAPVLPFVFQILRTRSYYLWASIPNDPELLIDPNPADESPVYKTSPEPSSTLSITLQFWTCFLFYMVSFLFPWPTKCPFSVTKFITYPHPLLPSSLLHSPISSIYQLFFFPAFLFFRGWAAFFSVALEPVHFPAFFTFLLYSHIDWIPNCSFRLPY